jgi:hypothetical protein
MCFRFEIMELRFYKDGVAQGDQVTGLGTECFIRHNFGNPPFAITTGNADADGFGNFEYAVPSGYYALCTNNLAEYG